LIALNPVGQSAYRTLLVGDSVDSSNEEGIWSEGTGSLSLVARAGDHAPGTPSEVVYSRLFGPAFNSIGQTAFIAFLTGDGLDGVSNQGVWSEGSGTLSSVALTGEHAPGTSADVLFRSFLVHLR